MTWIAVDRAQLTADLAALVQCPSVNTFGAEDPAGAEAAMAALFARQMKDAGLSVQSHEVAPGRRNVWGLRKGAGGGPTILLAGHMDTVGVDGFDDPFSGTLDGDLIYGRGSCDMKAGLAAYLEVVRCLDRDGITLTGDLIVAGVIDEEYAMIGSQDFGKNGPHYDVAIVAEPSSLAVCPAHKGQICTTIRTRGKAAHSSMPSAGRNAIFHMTTILNHLQVYAADLAGRPADPMCGQPSFSVGVIRGGQDACTVPDQCSIDIDRRIIPGETVEQVMSELQQILDRARHDEPDLDASLDAPFMQQPPLNTPHTHPLIEAMVGAVENVRGRADIAAFPGSTDAPNFRCPAVICGAGELAQCHAPGEHIAVSEIEDAVRIYVETILKLQSHKGPF